MLYKMMVSLETYFSNKKMSAHIEMLKLVYNLFLKA